MRSLRSLSRQARRASGLHLVECPRDAMQGLPNFVETKDKIRYINKLLEVGYHTVDFGSFVSAPAVPQMRDTAEVLKGLNLADTKSELLAVVCNVRGALDAAQYPEIKYLGFPLSISEEFQKRNTRKDIVSALDTLQKISEICKAANKELVTYISMAFGNPYDEPYSPELVSEFVAKVAGMGCTTISLADTVGCGTTSLIRDVFGHVLPAHPDIVIGAHLHSSSATATEKIAAVLEAGCKRIDSAVGGMGGCPFAKSALIGNVPTESVIAQCQMSGIEHGLDLKKFEEAQVIKHELFGVAVSEIILQCYLGDHVAFTDLCKTHFQDADMNRNGILSKDEFAYSVKKVIEELGEELPSDEKLDRLWKSANKSNPDGMTFDEYCGIARDKLLKRMASEAASSQ
eukprot:TRINITY_DN22265_c0_g1_i1.p1 TRINITY_DN22265_c0_g1~~TRINITY_DN22265_c0_g1_i1.p1  ORF type:complete len:401 (+),score=132.54 TRINITY_DN22265_c0_g1_i1:49-1251(+)